MTAVSMSGRAPVGLTLASGNYRIDDLLLGAFWGTRMGSGITLSYSFPSSPLSFETGYGNGEPLTGFGVLNVPQQFTFLSALDAWANVANLRFTRVDDTPDGHGEIRAAFTTTQTVLDALAYAYRPGTTEWSGDIWLNGNANWTSLSNGSYNFMALMHEVGHALGLSHPFGGNSAFGGSLPAAEDSRGNTVMSYSAVAGAPGSISSVYPTTPMSYDIAAIQYLYGANMSYHAGDDTYVFAQGVKYYQTIWDAGGNDTIVWQSFFDGATIDLRPGHWSDLGERVMFRDSQGRDMPATDLTVQIYATVTIENATGGDAADTLIGNDVANVLTGGGGADTLTGGAGDDTLLGGDGVDTAVYGYTRASYALGRTPDGTLTVQDITQVGGDGKDMLVGVERLKFGNASVAVDMADTQAGGRTALLLGALRGTAALADAAEVGKLLAALSKPDGFGVLPSIFDGAAALLGGVDYPAAPGSTSNRTFVSVLFKNITGQDIDDATLSVFAGLLDDKQLTQPLLLGMAADLPLNQAQVGLAGLAQTGLVYTAPV